MTLANVITKTGGTEQSRAFLVRNGTKEKIDVVKSLNRSLQPWDILVVGYQPSATPAR